MRVTKIQIRNILGIEELEFEPGKITVLRGRNATGKTSVLQAIASVFEGGHDASLIRRGAEAGEMVLVLDDGTQIRKRITESGAKTVVSQGLSVTRKPAAFLEQLVDHLSFNPMEFLRASGKERRNQLLKALNLRVTIPGEGDYSLEDVDSRRAETFQERTAANRARKELESTIKVLEGQLPGGNAGDPLRVEAEIARTAELAEGLREAADLALRSARAKRDEELAAEQARHDDAMVKIQGRAAVEDADVRARYQGQIEEARGLQGQAEEMARSAAGFAATAKHVREMRARLEEHDREANQMTKELEKIDAAKLQAMAGLPFPTLSVDEENVYVAGIPFDRVNLAEQIRIAIELAKRRAGPLGLICVDGLEHMDSDFFIAFQREAMKSSCQFVVARVADVEPMEVECQDGAPA